MASIGQVRRKRTRSRERARENPGRLLRRRSTRSAPCLEPLEGRMLLTSPLVNGGFDLGPVGLDGWQVTDTSLVTVNHDHRAIISESASVSEVDLFQDFGIPTDASTLAFML